MALVMLLLSLIFMVMPIKCADILKNPDFESPPTNITANNNSSFLTLTEANTIPGWSFNGTVRYVTSGPQISLRGQGHGVQLGKNGKINQSFIAKGYPQNYVLTFTLASGNENCSNNTIGVNVSAPERSKVFLLERRYGNKTWESHAHFMGFYDDETEPVNLEILSVSMDSDSNVTCWPVVDAFLITRIGSPRGYGDNMLMNNGFEAGPAFPKDSSEGILLNEEPDGLQSPLQQWSVIGTVKYIDSKHYHVPEGKAAIELVSGAPSGVQIMTILSKGSSYTLEFLIGDANNSCLGDLNVYVQIGMDIQNCTIRSNGTGSVKKCSITFKASSNSITPISFTSFNETKTRDNVLCGPVIDNVVLRSSYGSSYGLLTNLPYGLLVSCFVLTMAVLKIR